MQKYIDKFKTLPKVAQFAIALVVLIVVGNTLTAIFN